MIEKPVAFADLPLGAAFVTPEHRHAMPGIGQAPYFKTAPDAYITPGGRIAISTDDAASFRVARRYVPLVAPLSREEVAAAIAADGRVTAVVAVPLVSLVMHNDDYLFRFLGERILRDAEPDAQLIDIECRAVGYTPDDNVRQTTPFSGSVLLEIVADVGPYE